MSLYQNQIDQKNLQSCQLLFEQELFVRNQISRQFEIISIDFVADHNDAACFCDLSRSFETVLRVVLASSTETISFDFGLESDLECKSLVVPVQLEAFDQTHSPLLKMRFRVGESFRSKRKLEIDHCAANLSDMLNLLSNFTSTIHLRCLSDILARVNSILVQKNNQFFIEQEQADQTKAEQSEEKKQNRAALLYLSRIGHLFR